MKRTTILSAILLCGVLHSCNSKKETETVETDPATVAKTYPQLEKAGWFIGNWGNTTPEGTLTESWKKKNDSVYKGQSFFVIGKDTVFAEYIDLAETNGKLIYTVSVKGQNNEAPVSFEMTSATESQMVFENPKHDYPTKITYNKINNDSLVAEISGMQKGKPAKETFTMKRQ
ncbi:hypothetical protein HYN59_16770 [Flavobacterium album]|uniref:DUF6265 domain-containing protein n=1 Tax=Flavobacterium album TaxID=2175091 RepID=A0A2S1R1V8_9FLAO|nr:DUF6265 family protein [Flavobacterium album]AWH86658.1 hypothetical protein HYN59_16770 [Flavobacterium album]